MMKKIILVLVSALSALSITSASAVDVSNGSEFNDWVWVASNGSNYVATWTHRPYQPNETGIGDISVSVKRGSGTWSIPVLLFANIDSVIQPAASIKDNGKVVVAYSADGQINVQQSGAKNTIFTSAIQLEAPDGFEFVDDFALNVTGNNSTIIAAVKSDDKYYLYSWDNKNNSNVWKRKEVLQLFTSSSAPICNGIDFCNPYVSTINVESNSAGLMTVAVSSAKAAEPNSPDLTLSSYFIEVVQRKSFSKAWKSPQTISSFGPVNVYQWNNWTSSIVTTPKGKTAISFSRLFNDETRKDKIFVSSKFGKPFKATDVRSLNKGVATANLTLSNSGEKVYAAFNRVPDDTYTTTDTYLGVVGKLARAKKLNFDNTYFIQSFHMIKGKAKIVVRKDPRTIKIATKKKKSWKLGSVAFTVPEGYEYSWGFSFRDNSKLVIVGIYDYIDDPNQGWGKNVDVVLVK